MDDPRFWAAFAGCSAGLIIGSLAGVAILVGLYAQFLVYRSRSWSSVMGTVLAASATESGSSDSNWVYPKVTYAYDVAGQRHTGTRIAFGWPSSPAYTSQRRALANYPLNGPILVYYDPSRPSSAVLERRQASKSVWIVAAVLLVIAVVAPVLMVVAGLAAMSTG